MKIGAEFSADPSPIRARPDPKQTEVMASEPQDPVPLVRPAAGLKESWFDAPPRQSLTSIPPSAPSMPPSAPFAKVSPGRAILAGAVAGIFGGVAFALVPQLVSEKTKHPVPVARVFGMILTRDVDNQSV